MSHIFISYSRQDSQCAQQIVRRLEAQGFTVWFDTHSIPGGNQWTLEIQKGIQQAFAMLVLWSTNAMQSVYVQQEYELGFSHRMQHPDTLQLIPVLLEPLQQAPLPDMLKGFNAVQLQDCQGANEFKRLIASIQAIPNAVGRRTVFQDKSLPLADQPDQHPIPGTPLLAVPFMESVYTRAHLIAQPATIPQSKPPKMQLCLEFRGQDDDYQFIQQIHVHCQAVGQDVFALHITPQPQAGQYGLPNDQTGAWLDAVNTTYAATETLVGRGGAIVEVYSLGPAVLTFALGKLFYEYWHLQLFNFTKPGYQKVLDTKELL